MKSNDPLPSIDTLFIKTYGCQMNEYDSSRMVDLMRQAYGLRLVAKPEEADVILMNTCSVREKAEEKVYSELGRYRKLKLKNPSLIIGVGGCVAQQEGQRIQQRAPYVDAVFGPQAYHHLPAMINKIRRERVRVADIDMPEIEKFDYLPRTEDALKQGVSAYVTIMEGCDKFCTFCVVPYTRGGEISRPVDDVLAECRTILSSGCVEITLLGQNVNGYRALGPDGDEWDFTMLLYALADLKGLKRLRFTTSHPSEMNEDLAIAFAEISTLMPFIHLPVQSGSDRILKLMHRGHDTKVYLETIDTLRKHCPGIALSSDFIVGYPGETDADFDQTLALVRQVGYDSAYCFKYSPRPGTPASECNNDVAENIKDKRLQQLLALMHEQSSSALQRHIGTIMLVLVDKKGKKEGDIQGRTEDFKIVHFKGNVRLIGHVVRVEITEAYGQSLRGNIVINDDEWEY
ncbi:MAG: tRNA (N6-isopentenyl adenosine(37)-C2)-methylthiotransferase MiaB [Mariprofundaceae bacterium]|nr:tRNA (N6-isopentenyl adenosine(37)-C2)-methylthiotransferase MiaB [Mariprofundaceae bacterium]